MNVALIVMPYFSWDLRSLIALILVTPSTLQVDFKISIELGDLLSNQPTENKKKGEKREELSRKEFSFLGLLQLQDYFIYLFTYFCCLDRSQYYNKWGGKHIAV